MIEQQETLQVERELTVFVGAVCPRISPENRVLLVKEMKRAFRKWVLAEPSARKASIEASRIRMEQKFGITPRQIPIEIAFSKRVVANEKLAKERAEKYINSFALAIVKRREEKAITPMQMDFKIDGVSMEHPDFAVVSVIASGTNLMKSEVKHGKGRANRRKAGRPAFVQLGQEILPSVEVR